MRFFGTLRALRPLELLRAFDLLWLVGPLEARAVKLGLAVVLPMCVLVLMVLVRTLQVAELEAQLVRDIAPAHLAGRRREARGLAALREVDLRVVPQAVDELAGVPFGPGEAFVLLDQPLLGSMVGFSPRRCVERKSNQRRGAGECCNDLLSGHGCSPSAGLRC